MAAKERTNEFEHLDHEHSVAGEHAVGTGVGVAGGAVAGATAGAAMGGPVAAVVGGVIGAVAGGLVGRGAAQAAGAGPRDGLGDREGSAGSAIGGAALPAAAAGGSVAGPLGAGVASAAAPRTADHDEEDAYWREHHVHEPYYNPERRYEDYQPAYRLGWESRARYDEGTFDTYEPSFRNDWDESFRAQSRLTWAEARHAARAGWERFERKQPGGAGGNGR